MKRFLLPILTIPFISATLVLSIYEALKITKADAKELLLHSIGSSFVARDGHPDLISDAKNLSAEEQVEGVKQLIQLAKEYTASEQFKTDYKKWRSKQLNSNAKTKLGVPRLGKILENKIDNAMSKSDNEKQYPSDPDELIKKRLTDFLAISATVDFDEKLTDARMFVNPDYEKKSGQWKMCYRAGKEVVEAARAEAQKWLDELNEKK